MLCFHRDLRAGMIGCQWCQILNLRKWQCTCPWHFLRVDSRPFSLYPCPFAATRHVRFIQRSRLKGTPYEASLLLMAPPVSLLKWYFALSSISDGGQIIVIPHKLYSVIIMVFVNARVQIAESRPLTETRGLWLRVLTQYLFHSIAKRSLSRLDLNTSTSSW